MSIRFLWVALQLDAICDEASDDNMREVLKTLPSDLTETYRRILRRSSAKDSRQYHVRLFKFIAAAYKPLSLGQIREMAAVVKGIAVWDPHKQINDATKVLRYCGSLITVDEEECTVRFVHHSARKFCQGALGGNLDWHFSDNDAHREMGETAVTYLNYGIFDTRLSNRVVPKVEVQKLPEHVIQNALGRSRLSKSFFKPKQGPRRDIGQVLASVGQQHDSGNELAEYPFLKYARKFWLPHTRNLDPSAQSTFKLWKALIKKMDFQQLDLTQRIAGPLDDFQITHKHPSVPAIFWAINHSHLPLFDHLMQTRHDNNLSFRLVLQKLLFLRAVFKHLSLKQSDLPDLVVELHMAQRLLPISVRLGVTIMAGWMARCIVSAESASTFADSIPVDNSSKTGQGESMPWSNTGSRLYRPHSLVLLAASMQNVPMLCRLAGAGLATSPTENARALSLLLETGIDQALLLRACCTFIDAGLSPQILQENQLYSILRQFTNSSGLNVSVRLRAIDWFLDSLRTAPALLFQLFRMSCAKGNLEMTKEIWPWLPDSTGAVSFLLDTGISDLVLHSISKGRIQLALWLVENAAEPHIESGSPECLTKRAVLLRCWPLALKLIKFRGELDALRHFCTHHELFHHAILASDMDGVGFFLELGLDINQPSKGPEYVEQAAYQAVISDESRWHWWYSFGKLLRCGVNLESAKYSDPFFVPEIRLERFLVDNIDQQPHDSARVQQILDSIERVESEEPFTTRTVTGKFFCLVSILMRHIILLHFPKNAEVGSYLTVDPDQRQAGFKQLVRSSRLLDRASTVGFDGTSYSEHLFLIAFHELLGIVPYFDLNLGPDADSLRFNFKVRMRIWHAMKLILDNIKFREPRVGWQTSDLVRRLSVALTREPKLNVLPYFEGFPEKEPPGSAGERLLQFLQVATQDQNFAWLLECMLARCIGFEWWDIASVTARLNRSFLCAQDIGNEMSSTAAKILETLGCDQTFLELLAKSISKDRDEETDDDSDVFGTTPTLLKRRNAVRVPNRGTS